MPSKKITITIQEQDIEISYPKAGQFIDIAILKTKLSDGQYNRLFLQQSHDSGLSTKLIDCFSFLSIVVEDIKEKLNIGSLYDLELIDAIELIDVYENTIVPWMIEWTETINKKIEELENKSKQNKLV